MADTYFLEIRERSDRVPIGRSLGYGSLEEAISEAKKYVDDALPNNTVRVMKMIGRAYLRGDGEVGFDPPQ